MKKRERRNDRTTRQKEGISKWINSNLRGTLKWATGTGKTRASMMAIHLLYKNNKDLNVVIAVPTLNLQEQWILELKERKLPGRVYTINSLIKTNENCDLLILDEIHRYASDTFSQVFKVVKYKYILGLSATFERLDGGHNILSKYAPVVDTITIEDALNNGWLSNFVEYKVMLRPKDIDVYNEANREFLDAFSYFNNDFALAMKCHTDWKARTEYTKKLMGGIYDPQKFKEQNKLTLIKAAAFNRSLNKRKQYIYNHPAKIAVAKYILDRRKDRKCITFSSRADVAKAIGRGTYLTSSRGTKKEQREILKKFIEADTGVLNTCKMLDEGADIPGLSVAVILGFNSSKTAKTQRIGRVIRKEKDKIAEIFTLVLEGTVDEQWFMNSNDSEYITIGVNQLDDVLSGKPFTPKANKKVGITVRF